jgi:hypothetical protein
MSMIRRCPRCDAVVPRWQPVHLSCFLKRSWFVWVTLLLVMGGLVIGLGYLISYLVL